jgi:hypothetical protein
MTVDLLALAHDRGCEAELAEHLEEDLRQRRIPDIPTLRALFGPSEDVFPAVTMQMADLVVRFRHLAPIFACPRPNVEISRTTSNYKFLVAFLNLTFVRRDCSIWDTNVKFTPLADTAVRVENAHKNG